MGQLLWDDDQKLDPVARFVGVMRMARDLGVEFDVGPWARAAEAITSGTRPALEDIATLSDWDGVDAEMWESADQLPRLMAAMIDAAANTAEDYHRRMRESEVIEDAAEAGEAARLYDDTQEALSRIMAALGAPAPADPRTLTQELEAGIARWGRSAVARVLADTEGSLRRQSLDVSVSSEVRKRARAALDAWRLARTQGAERNPADDHEVTWEATPAQSMGVASAVELALLLGVEPAQVDRALVASAGDRPRALAALRKLIEAARVADARADVLIRVRDDVDRWVRRQGEVLAALGPFARDQEWVGVLHRMISEMADALGNGTLPPRDLVIVSEQVLSATKESALGLQLVQARAGEAIQRQRADRLEAGLRAMSAPHLTCTPWLEGADLVDVVGMIERSKGDARAWASILDGIPREWPAELESTSVMGTVVQAATAATTLAARLSHAAEVLSKLAATATHQRTEADPVVVE